MGGERDIMAASLFKKRVKVASKPNTYVLFRSTLVHTYSNKRKVGMYHFAKRVSPGRVRAFCDLITTFDMHASTYEIVEIESKEDLEARELPFTKGTKSRGTVVMEEDVGTNYVKSV